MKRLIFSLLLGIAWPLAAREPRPPVQGEVPVELKGVSPSTAAEVRLVVEKQLALSGDRTASGPLADDLAFFVRQRYFQMGYAAATVDWEVLGSAVVLVVDEGARRTVGRIEFTGVDAAQGEILADYLTRQTREREGRLAKELPLVEADLEAGVGLVVRRLQADGFLQATAVTPALKPDPVSGRTNISVALKPGALSVFDEVRVEGDATPLSRAAQEKITALAGQPFSEVRLENLRKEMKGDLQRQGRFAAEVLAVARPRAGPGGRVPSVVTVQPGALFKVSEIRVTEELGRGARRVAGSVFDAAAGQVYAPETLDLLYRRSLDTGIFSRLDVAPVTLSADTLALTISGEEAKPRTLGFFGGYETFYGPIAGVEARHVNFLDSGNSLGLRAELRGTGASGSVQFTDPAVLGSRNALGLGASLETFTFKDYMRDTVAVRGSLTRRLNRRITAELFSTFTLNEAESEVLTPEELGPESYSTQTAGGRLTADYRDHPLNPKSGWLAGISVEGGFDQGGTEDLGFVRTEVNAAWYQPLSERWRVAVGGRAASLRSSGGVDALPIDLRLFNGGAGSVRSFAEREMGPSSQNGSTPLGGTATAVVSAEVSYQIIPNLEVAGFADVGSLSREETSGLTTDELRYAVGLGLRYQLPVGPLRIDYGYNPDRKPGEKPGALHLTFGFAF